MKFSRELSIICCAAALLIATPRFAAAQNGLAAQQAAAAQAKAAQQAAAQAAAARAKAAQQAAAQAAAARAKAAQQAAAQAAAARAKATQQAAAQAAAAKAKAAQQAAAQAAAAQAKAAQQAAAHAAAAKAKAAQQAAAQASPQKPNIPSQPKVVSPKPNDIQPKIVAPNVAQPKIPSSKPNIIQPKITDTKVVQPKVVSPNGNVIQPQTMAPKVGQSMVAPSPTADQNIKITLPSAQLNMQPPQQSMAAPSTTLDTNANTAVVRDTQSATEPTRHPPMAGPVLGIGILADIIAAQPPATTDRTVTTAINSNQAIPLATADRTAVTTLSPGARSATEPMQDIKITLPTQQPSQQSTAAPSNQSIPLVTTPLATTDSTIASPFNSTHLATSKVLDTLNLPTLNADSPITPRAQSLATSFSADQVTNAPSARLNPSATLDLSATRGVLNTQEGSPSDRPLNGYEVVARSTRYENGSQTHFTTWCSTDRTECFKLPAGMDISQRRVYEAQEAQKAREAEQARKAQEDFDASNWNGTLARRPQTVVTFEIVGKNTQTVDPEDLPPAAVPKEQYDYQYHYQME